MFIIMSSNDDLDKQQVFRDLALKLRNFVLHEYSNLNASFVFIVFMDVWMQFYSTGANWSLKTVGLKTEMHCIAQTQPTQKEPPNSLN